MIETVPLLFVDLHTALPTRAAKRRRRIEDHIRRIGRCHCACRGPPAWLRKIELFEPHTIDGTATSTLRPDSSNVEHAEDAVAVRQCSGAVGIVMAY